MNRFFAELGKSVYSRWKETNFSLPAFPEIATRALEEKPPASNVKLSKLVSDFLLNDEQPHQSSSGFGQPELIVYDNPRFYIQLLYWLEGTTQIHQHEFSGAFHVMLGSSIQTQFAFDNPKPVSAHFRVGDLRIKETRLLETGSTVPIISGGGCIHSLFHLDTPSLTVVVRTHSDPGTGPQFTYLPPHLAVDPFFTDALTSRRTQLLDVLERTDDPAYTSLVQEMVADLDFERSFFILQNGIAHLRNLGAWDEVWSVFQRKHGPLARYVLPTLEEILWRDTLIGLRSTVTEVEHRFFLALLLNLPHRADILKVVAQRFHGDAIGTIMRWAEELTETTEYGTRILDAEFPEDSGIPIEEQPEIFLNALRLFLKVRKLGTPPPGKMKAVHQAFAHSSLRSLVS